MSTLSEKRIFNLLTKKNCIQIFYPKKVSKTLTSRKTTQTKQITYHPHQKSFYFNHNTQKNFICKFLPKESFQPSYSSTKN